MTHVLDQISVTTDPSSYMPSNFSGLFSDLSLRYRFLGSSIVHTLQVTRHRDSEYQDPTRSTSLSSMPHGRGRPHLSTQTSKLTKVPLNISIQDLIPSQQSPSQPAVTFPTTHPHLISPHLTSPYITSHHITSNMQTKQVIHLVEYSQIHLCQPSPTAMHPKRKHSQCPPRKIP